MNRPLGCVLVLFACLSVLAQQAPPMRLLLRIHGGSHAITLGTPIVLEYACMAEPDADVRSGCNPQFEVKPLSPTGSLTLDPAYHPTLDDGLCAVYPVGICGTVPEVPKLAFTPEPEWKEEKIASHVPASAGLYEIRASVLSGTISEPAEFRATPIQIEVVDDPQWHETLLHYEGCQTNTPLAVLPDEPRAEAALRKHLGECAKESDFSLRDAIEEIVSLQLHTRATDVNHKLQALDAVMETRDKKKVKAVQRWFQNAYRQLLLETANQLIAEFQANPKDEQVDSDVDMGFYHWGQLLDPCNSNHPLLPRQEVERLLHAGGRDQETIRNFFK